jgi:hypothetical protein
VETVCAEHAVLNGDDRMQSALAVAKTRETVEFQLEYGWKPFTVACRHLDFRQHCSSRLCEGDCNHWGPAIYKWEGRVTEGEYAGRTGILIGETGDLRQRIKQYISGTQEHGNKYWREQFLTKGDVYLYVLESPRLRFKGPLFEWVNPDLSSNSIRLVLEQSLVFREISKGDGARWIVNRKL